MDLQRLLADTQPCRDLLVAQSIDDARQNLAFAESEACELSLF